ncbi:MULTISPECIES: HAMP domain-containing sensor histidine kinase [unclassified Streptomyces]|uniref:sensor histidine kinase n=1 Tax=unclassified Streptomyces TaxID=2593676 RepID=UPI000477BBEA|nr:MULTISPECIES: HAMP domain-containing sensor histidine kinase [unclassified Streptomyces]MYX35826.1 two-component sensor histidine kinase [Streptomyces sp. SID8377]
MRLSTRVALAVGVVVPLLVLASGVLLIRLVAADLHAQQDAHLRERAAAVATDAKALLRATAADRPAAEQARTRRLFSSALDVGIRLTGPEGTVSGGPQPDASAALPARAPSPVTIRAGGARWRVLSVPVNGSRKGVRGTLWLFSPDAATKTQVEQVRRRVVTVALLAAPVSALLAWAAAGRAVRPLRRLQQRASGLDPRVSSVRLDHAPTRITEVDDLARTLQTVLARYDEQAARTGEALATARSFAAAASHELRNPLMSMGTNLDVLAGHPDLPAAERHEIVDDLGAEHARVLGLLVMLRALAQGDLVEEDAFGPVDAAELVDASAAGLRRRHPGARVEVTAAPGLLVHGWEQGLRSMTDNLLTNAAVHGAAPGGRPDVEVTLRRGGDGHAPAVVLTVDDHGPGIPPGARAAVFARFHRRADSPGSGLGLTLVAQQIALHRGTIAVLDRPDGAPGTRFEVRLPLSGVRDGGQPTLPLPRRDWLSGRAGEPREPQGFHKDAP